MVAVGLCFYSAVQVVNNSVARLWLPQYFHLPNTFRVVSFDVAFAHSRGANSR